jgi:hypothetical protein
MNFRKWNPLNRAGWANVNRRRDRLRLERNPWESEGGRADVIRDLASPSDHDLERHGHDLGKRVDSERGLISRRRLAQGLGMACAGLGLGFGGRASGQPKMGMEASRGEDGAETLKIVFVGDIMLDGGPGNWVSLGKDPFARCQPLFDGADLRIGNLECVLGGEGERQSKPYVFRGAGDSAGFLQRYFDAVSLANNHTLDYGPEGLLGCMAELDKVGVPYFGAGKNLKRSRRPLVLEKKGRRVGLLGFNEFYAEEYAAGDKRAGNNPLEREALLADIERCRGTLGCDVVLPFLHWGEEMESQPRDDQRALAKECIEAGATAVIGAHPHVVQTIDVHRGKPIVYSLGNFVFDYFAGDPELWTGWVTTLEISPSGDVGLRIDAVTMDPAGIPSPVVPGV